jgi:hypothetical protein
LELGGSVNSGSFNSTLSSRMVFRIASFRTSFIV